MRTAVVSAAGIVATTGAGIFVHDGRTALICVLVAAASLAAIAASTASAIKSMNRR